jgi:hypothetical protein
MIETFNVYCDESCHLPNDGQRVMVLGAVWCPVEKAREIAVRLREIKAGHGLLPDFEVKWSKVSASKMVFYRDYLDYFFDDDDLHFRAWVADKIGLDHDAFAQSHDDWYYKMMFGFLEPVIRPDAGQFCVRANRSPQSAFPCRFSASLIHPHPIRTGSDN